MEGITYSFQKLTVWQESKKLVVDVYHLLESFPKFEHEEKGKNLDSKM